MVLPARPPQPRVPHGAAHLGSVVFVAVAAMGWDGVGWGGKRESERGKVCVSQRGPLNAVGSHHYNKVKVNKIPSLAVAVPGVARDGHHDGVHGGGLGFGGWVVVL